MLKGSGGYADIICGLIRSNCKNGRRARERIGDKIVTV
jgi:hypothetical protein